MPVPVGLLGFAISTARVSGRSAASTSSSGKASVSGILDLADCCAGDLGVEAVHRVGGLEQHYFVAVVDVGVDQKLNRFVGAVGERELVGGDWKNAASSRERVGVLGIDRKRGWRSDVRVNTRSRAASSRRCSH